MGKPIELIWTDPQGVIIEGPGVEYENQASGVLCSHPRATGVFVPLPGWAINALGCTPDCCADATPADADAVDEILAAHDSENRVMGLTRLRADRERLEEATEAWFPVTGWIFGVEVKRGILTWENCD